ncbi:MAG TPA: hypothetical protein VJ770_01835 [Stellaceae bacterium]|nr:hypothetical protein [Stellaceae bacterium]
MAQIGVGRAALLGAGIVGLLMAGTARAQMPPEAAEITYCLCTQREVSQLSAEMRAKMGALHRANQRVSDLNAQLRQDREGLDVNNPAAVEHYKLLLEEHDRAWKASVGPVWTAARAGIPAAPSALQVGAAAPHPPAARVPPSPRSRGEGRGEGRPDTPQPRDFG